MNLTSRRLAVLLAASTVATTVGLAPPASATATGATPGRCDPVISFKPPAGTDVAFGVTQGPGGTWYAHGSTINRIGGGHLDQFPITGPTTPDVGWLAWDRSTSRVWFADRANGRLGTIDGHGVVREFTIPPGTVGVPGPQGIVIGPGPHVWFTDQINSRLGRLDTRTGSFTLYPIPTAGGGPLGLTRGPDAALWFTERPAAKVGRMTDDGVFTEWSIAAGAFPNRIVVGPDGNVWFTELNANKVGRIDPTTRTLTEFSTTGGPVGLTVVAHHMYVALWQASLVARLETDGTISRTWAVPGALQVAGSHGSVWATDPFTDSVSRVRPHC